MQFNDDLERRIYLDKAPRKIISLCPSLSETLYDLGLAECIAGRTDYCVHPQELADRVPSVGGPKSVSIDAVKKIGPDLILIVKEENDKKNIEKLTALGYKCFIFDINSVSDALKMLVKLGKIFGLEKKASKIHDNVVKGLDSIKGIGNGASFLYMVWNSPYMACATDNYINSLLNHAGLSNCLSDRLKRYVIMPLNSLKSLSPELVLLPSEPYRYTFADRAKFEKIFPAARVELVDGEMFCWYGSRMAKASEYIKKLLN